MVLAEVGKVSVCGLLAMACDCSCLILRGSVTTVSRVVVTAFFSSVDDPGWYSTLEGSGNLIHGYS